VIPLGEPVIGILRFAVNSLDLQQQAAANNIANAQTPDFTATEVSFQNSLQAALQSPSPGATAAATTYASPAAPASDGNNVDVTQEMMTLERSTLQSQTMVELLNDQFRMVRGAMGGGFS
jgi:flagellar basal-body rod protein FlgB